MFPELFHLHDFNLPTYGVLFGAGIVLGFWVSGQNSERLGIDGQKARNLGLLVGIWGIVGAKILAIVNSWEFYAAHPREMFSLTTLQEGGVYLGGLLAALLAAGWYMRRHQMPALSTADAFAPGIALGHAVGRIGCFAAGCCWGKPTEAFWGVTFKDSLAQQWAGTPLGVTLIPTQLLEAGFEFASFVFLMWQFQKRKFDGQVIGAYLLLYGLARFGLEYLRDDPGRGSFWGGALSGMQLLCVALLVAGAFLWVSRSSVLTRGKEAPSRSPTSS